MTGHHYNIGPSAQVAYADGSNRNDIIIDDDVDIFGCLCSQSHGIIKIGSHVRVGRGVIIRSVERVEIGNNVVIAANTIITDNNTHPTSVKFRRIWAEQPPMSEMHLWKYSAHLPVVISENVWIGENVRICKGVTIGNSSVIAASSVVTKDVPPNSIAAGNPARIVKTNIDELEEPQNCQTFNQHIENREK